MNASSMNGSRNLFVNFIFFILIIIVYIYFEESKNASVKANDTLSNNSNAQKILKNIYQKLVSSERRVYSKLNVDGVIETVYQLIKVKNLKKFYVEIGAGTGKNS
jgi:putative lipase involved disintegration of autophagic bodies